MQSSRWASKPEVGRDFEQPTEQKDAKPSLPLLDPVEIKNVKEPVAASSADETTTQSVQDTYAQPAEVGPTGYDPNMDEFAQTRPPDNLFDDDFTPMNEPIIEVEAPEPVEEPTSKPSYRGRGGRGGRRGAATSGIPNGRGRGNRHGGDRIAASTAVVENSTPEGQEGSSAPSQQNGVDEDGSSIPTGPAKPRVEAVRGDRSATGGIKKAKLTEEELTARMQAMALKSSQREAAHARAIADMANFEAREAEAAQRRKEERVNRQQMMGEREKNRHRKIQAQGRREWDHEKNEDDLIDRNSRPRRGMYGGVAGGRNTAVEDGQDPIDAERGSRDEQHFARGRGWAKGRGGRGRGRGRGDFMPSRSDGPAAQAVPSASDFPELPTAGTKTSQESLFVPGKLEVPGKAGFNIGSSVGDIRSWADQVEAMSPDE